MNGRQLGRTGTRGPGWGRWRAVAVGLALLLMLAVWLNLPAAAGAQIDGLDRQPAPLRVVITEVPPFVNLGDARVTGLSIDVWEEVAARAGVDFEYVTVENAVAQISHVADGYADVAVSALSMTPERAALVDFSVPFAQAGLQIMVRNEGSVVTSLREGLSVSLSPAVLRILAAFLGLIFLVANIVWFVDRKTNDEFPRPYLRGVWEAI
jgi:polar amino acid transport system substrate-binding protein